jgi:hypothetical protein
VVLLSGGVRRQRVLILALLAVLAIALGAARARVSATCGDGPVISCEPCCTRYWSWWCYVAWGCECPDAGGGGDSGARSTRSGK